MRIAIGILGIVGVFAAAAYFMAQTVGWKFTALIWAVALGGTAVLIGCVFLIAGGVS